MNSLRGRTRHHIYDDSPFQYIKPWQIYLRLAKRGTLVRVAAT